MKDQIMAAFCVQTDKILFINLFNDQSCTTSKSLDVYISNTLIL